MSSPPKRVLVVDDSPFVRQVLVRLLSEDPRFLVVETAGDGEEALGLVARTKPDVITLDLQMPRMNGAEFLRALAKICVVPVVIVSAAHPDGSLAADAMEAGAFDFVQKPTSLADQRLERIGAHLRKTIWAACETKFERLDRSKEPPSLPTNIPTKGYSAVVIGLSTGGPQLLYRAVPKLRGDFAFPLGIVLHMPEGFTGPLAERLNDQSELEVVEASDGMPFIAGRVVIGRARSHLSLSAGGDGPPKFQLSTTPESLYCPSADILFESASKVYTNKLLAIVLTGMGSDGREGAAWVKARGGTVVVGSEESSIIYGMPRAVKEAGLSDGEIDSAVLAEFLNSLRP